MQATLHNIGKQFGKKWIFKGLNFTFETAQHSAITGGNGSGKSTLLLMLAGYITPTGGRIEWAKNGSSITHHELFAHIALASPYLELIEEFSLEEMLLFQLKFKSYLAGITVGQLVELSGLADSKNKPLKHFSSGMKQRVKLLLAIMSSADLVLLDEPCSNLDKKAVEWYQNLKNNYGANRSFIICSNHNNTEYPEVERILSI